MPVPLRAIVVDDHALSRAVLRDAIEADATISVVGEGADGREAIGLVARLRPDVALLDVRMPVLDGVAAAREIARRWPEVTVVLCSSDPAPVPGVSAARFLSKEAVTAGELRDAHDGTR